MKDSASRTVFAGVDGLAEAQLPDRSGVGTIGIDLAMQSTDPEAAIHRTGVLMIASGVVGSRWMTAAHPRFGTRWPPTGSSDRQKATP